MVSSPIFDCGSKMHSFGTGLRAGLIPAHLSIDEVKRECAQSFKYNPESCPNPKGTMTHFRSCFQRCGGFCKKDDLTEWCQNLTYNTYLEARNWKPDFPVFVEFEIPGRGLTMCALLGRLVGKGEHVGLSRMIRKPKEGEIQFDYAEPDTVPVGNPGLLTSIPRVSNQIFMDFLMESSAACNVDPKTFTELTLRRWKYAQDVRVRRFRVLRTSVITEKQIPCIGRSKIKPASTLDLPFGLSSSSNWTPAASTKDSKLKGRGLSESNSSSNASDDGSWKNWSGVASSSNGGDESDAESLPPLPPEPPPEPLNAVGIKSWDVAPPRARAVCCVCNARIESGQYRLDYRFRESTSLRDQKRLHARCAGGLPDGTRARDVRMLATWIADPTIDDAAKAILIEVRTMLQPVG